MISSIVIGNHLNQLFSLYGLKLNLQNEIMEILNIKIPKEVMVNFGTKLVLGYFVKKFFRQIKGDIDFKAIEN